MPYMLEGRKLRPGRPFKNADGMQFPGNWLKLTSDEEKAAVGITWEADPAPFDSQYYYSAGNPRPIEDIALTNNVGRVDADGNPVLDADGSQIIDSSPALDSDGNQIYSPGLQSKLVADQARIAGQILSSTDWYAVRKAETSKAIPAAIKTYRAAVRTACDARQAEIAAVSTTEELEALMKAPDKVLDTDGETLIDNPDAHLTPWPDPVS